MGRFIGGVQRRVVARAALVGALALGSLALGSVSGASKPASKPTHTKPTHTKPTHAKPTHTKPTSQSVVKVTTISGFGQVLTTSSGMALYTYGPDSKNHSACTGSCATAWPALTVGAKVRPKGVVGLGTFRRSSTLYQVTYHGRPLYTYVGDTTAGTASGNGVGNFKLVIVKAAKGSSSTTTTTGASGGY